MHAMNEEKKHFLHNNMASVHILYVPVTDELLAECTYTIHVHLIAHMY